MPAVSEEELEQLREKNASLRDEIEEASTVKASAEADTQREYEAAQLIAENQRLEARLASAKAIAEAAQAKQGVGSLAQNTATELELAKRALENPAGVPVDTNASVEGDTGLAPTVTTDDVKTEDANQPNDSGKQGEGDKPSDPTDAPQITNPNPTAPGATAKADDKTEGGEPDLSTIAASGPAPTSTSKKGGN